MCIAIYKKKGLTIPRETLEQCFKINDDGAGYMYVKNGKLEIKKGFFFFESFYDEYKKDEKHQCVIHFRIKTHGSIDGDNCHPFSINNELAFVHNGIISGFGTKDKSDTFMFNEEVLKPLMDKYGKQLYTETPFKKLIEEAIGYSKLIFLDANGTYSIYNEHKGEWADGVWYSNSTYKIPKPLPPIENYSYSYSGQHTAANTGGGIIKLPSQEAKAKRWYIDKKKYGQEDLHQSDFATVNWPCNGLEKGDVVEIKHIYQDASCLVCTMDNSYINHFPGCYLDYFDPNPTIVDLRDDFNDFRD